MLNTQYRQNTDTKNKMNKSKYNYIHGLMWSVFLKSLTVNTETQNWSVRVEEVTFEFSTLNETSIPIPQEISQKRQQKE